jgi:hypothetical protein
MNSKQKKILDAVFEVPARANLKWRDLEKLTIALGGRVLEGSGSRVLLILNDEQAAFHRPHPGKEAKRYAVRLFKEFLRSAGVKP